MRLLLEVAAGALLCYALLLGALIAARPKGARLTDAVRLLPDVVGLLRRLAADRTLPRGVRVRLWLLLGYLAVPIDLVPDFVPVLGYADDAIVVALVLRSLLRSGGEDLLTEHWPGPVQSRMLIGRLVNGR
jgi:uncharacterized membrane protein YkvA (DUF1232 family)